MQTKIEKRGSPLTLYEIWQLVPKVLTLDFEKWVNTLFFHYEEAIFWGVIKREKVNVNSES